MGAVSGGPLRDAAGSRCIPPLWDTGSVCWPHQGGPWVQCRVKGVLGLRQRGGDSGVVMRSGLGWSLCRAVVGADLWPTAE